jgi:hypothetical protein
MTALFDEPLRVTLRPDRYPVETEHAVGLLMGFTIHTEGTVTQLFGIVCLADGRIDTLPPAAYTVNWRYDVEKDRFIDLDAGEPEISEFGVSDR